MSDHLEVKIVLQHRILQGANQSGVPQRVATVYINGKEHRVYAPSEAKGDALDWLPHFTVRQLVDFNSEEEVHGSLRVLALKVVKEELASEKEAGARPGLLGPEEFAGMTDKQLHEVKMGAEPGSNYWEWATAEQQERARKARSGLPTTTLGAREKDTSLPAGLYGPKEFAAMTDEQLHQVKMGSEPASNYWQWATAEQQERQRKAQPGVLRTTAAPPTRESVRWDFFISHANEDKEEIAGPLANALREDGWAVWYDEFSLRLGDSLRESIDRGLAASRFGIVILSPHFFAKHWTKQELNGLATREVSAAKVILPVWHKVGFEEVREYSATLADRVAVGTDKGLKHVVERILDAATAAPTSVTSSARGGDLIFGESVYWKRKDSEMEGPYCPNCYDDKHKQIHLTPGATKGTYRCGVCGNSFATEAYNPKPVRRLSFRGRRPKPETDLSQPRPAAHTPAVLTAPLPDVRVEARVTVAGHRFPRFGVPPQTVLAVIVSNHSPIAVYIENVRLALSNGGKLFFPRDAVTEDSNMRRALQPGDSFSFMMPPREIFRLASDAGAEPVYAFAVDAIGREYKSTEASLKAALDALRGPG
ncbi:MAG: toll/interleukin-1 receptor domain-containing protein [Terriglobia bacterium]|jgi:ribosomal protein L37AE/L43A